MPVIINCDNKGCMKPQAARLNLLDNTVLCDECGGKITNITSFTKNTLKTLGQTTKRVETNDTYAISCAKCEVKGTPVLDKGKFFCKACKKEHTNISEPFKLMLQSVLGNANK